MLSNKGFNSIYYDSGFVNTNDYTSNNTSMFNIDYTLHITSSNPQYYSTKLSEQYKDSQTYKDLEKISKDLYERDLIERERKIRELLEKFENSDWD